MIERFVFPIATLKKEVEKRTSYMGKMRGTEESPNLLDRLALTEGESFLTDEYLDEAAAETYDWVKAFGRNVRNAYRVVPEMEMKEVIDDWRVKMLVGGSRVLPMQVKLPAENVQITEIIPEVLKANIPSLGIEEEFVRDESLDSKDAGIWFYGWRTKFSMAPFRSKNETLVEADALYSVDDPTAVYGSIVLVAKPDPQIARYNISGTFSPVQIEIGVAAAITVRQRISWTEGFAGLPFVDVKYEEQDGVMTTDGVAYGFQFTIEMERYDERYGERIIKSVNNVEVSVIAIVPATPVLIVKGDFVRHEDVNGDAVYGIAAKSGLPVVLEEELDDDFRNSIVFTLEIPRWTDVNMLPSVKRNLKEALVDWIIYRWFETVNPKEADDYQEKFEEKAHQAQLGLNTENKTLQRNAGWMGVNEWG